MTIVYALLFTRLSYTAAFCSNPPMFYVSLSSSPHSHRLDRSITTVKALCFYNYRDASLLPLLKLLLIGKIDQYRANGALP